MIAGVVYDPIRDEMFTAERGAGAYLNNRRIHVSSARRLADSLASTGFPSRKRHHNVNIHFYYQLAMASHGVRRTGFGGDRPGLRGLRTAGLFLGIRPQAVGHGGGHAAGGGSRRPRFRHARRALISVTDSEHLLADNGALHDEMLAMFGEIFAGRFPVEMPGIRGGAGW